MKTVTPQKPVPKSDIKILVVDDREDNLFSIEAILEKDNYTIVKANSGRAALKILLNEHDFSLILMDVQMPDLNGFETATIIYERDKLKSIPIIFITAYSNDEDHVFRGYKMGGVDYIYKPINPELLRAKVAVFADLYRKNQQLILQEQKIMAINKNLQEEIGDALNKALHALEDANLDKLEGVLKSINFNRSIGKNNKQITDHYCSTNDSAYCKGTTSNSYTIPYPNKDCATNY